MKLSEFFPPNALAFDLDVDNKEEALAALIKLLRIGNERAESILLDTLKQREELGTTGIGEGIAIPHGRSLVIYNLKLVYGRLKKPIEYNSVDSLPVKTMFLIVAPPVDRKNRYLPILGRIAEISKNPETRKQLLSASNEEELFALLDQYEV